MSHSLPHLSLTTTTSSLSPTSPIFPTISPTHTRSLVHDPYLPCEYSTAECRINTNPISHTLSKSTARNSNLFSADVVFQRLHSGITPEIRKRSARQILSYWPFLDLPAPIDRVLQPSGGGAPVVARLAWHSLRSPPSILCSHLAVARHTLVAFVG